MFNSPLLFSRPAGYKSHAQWVRAVTCRFSHAPLGLPGRLMIRLVPRMPAAARDRHAFGGVICMDAARMASGIPGARAFPDLDGRLRRYIARCKAGAASGDDGYELLLVGGMDERGLDARLLVRQHLDRTDRVACPLEQILDGRAAQIPPARRGTTGRLL